MRHSLDFLYTPRNFAVDRGSLVVESLILIYPPCNYKRLSSDIDLGAPGLDKIIIKLFNYNTRTF